MPKIIFEVEQLAARDRNIGNVQLVPPLQLIYPFEHVRATAAERDYDDKISVNLDRLGVFKHSPTVKHLPAHKLVRREHIVGFYAIFRKNGEDLVRAVSHTIQKYRLRRSTQLLPEILPHRRIFICRCCFHISSNQN